MIKIFVLILCMMEIAVCQIKYPHPLKEGQSFVAPSDARIYWVITDQEMTNVLSAQESLKINEQLISIHKNKVDSLDKIINLKNMEITTYKESTDKFQTDWNICNEESRKTEKNVVRLKRGYFLAIPVSVVLSALLTFSITARIK